MFVPIGTFLTKTDTALAGSIDGIIGAMTSAMATPIALAAVIYYAVQGLRLANGDPAPLQGFVPQLIRVGTVIWLSSNLSAFNQWVRDIFFTGLPNALATTIGTATTSTTSPALSGGVTAAGAVFDSLWTAIWQVVGDSLMLAHGISVTGMVAGISGFLTAILCGTGLVMMAVIYVCARMVLATIICLSPILIGCAMFDVTRPIFERAVGKVIALILMQSLGLIVLQILLLGDQWFMARAITQILAAISNSAAFLEAMATLAGLCVWFIAGAFAMYNVPAVAYSIGSGIMVAPGAFAGAVMGRLLQGGGSSGNRGGGDASFSGGGSPPPNLSLSLNRPELGGDGGLAPQIPEAPLSIAHSTRR
jgi:type IV secretion system protein VirB6